jgi:hypothetical protein
MKAPRIGVPQMEVENSFIRRTMGGENKILQIFFEASPIEILCSDHCVFRRRLWYGDAWIVPSQCELSLVFGVYTTLWNVTPVLESLCLLFDKKPVDAI